MKRISLILGCTLLLWSCSNNNADHEGNMADTTIAPTDTMPQDGMINNTPADTTIGQTPADNNGGGANMSSSTTNNAGHSGSSAGSGSRGTASGGATASPKSGLAKTGQYNSDVATPEPLNLDDKRFRKTKPAHTYGDTAPRSRP